MHRKPTAMKIDGVDEGCHFAVTLRDSLYILDL